MDIVSVGRAAPLALLNGQPEIVLLDPGSRITNVDQQLNPFGSIVRALRNVNAWRDLCQTNTESAFVLILILSNRTRDEMIQFIHNEIFGQRFVHSFYLFFNNGQQYEVQLQALFAPIFRECYSITAQLDEDVRAVCSTACDLNINFCRRRARDEAGQGNNGLAGVIATQLRDRVRLQTAYHRHLEDEMDHDKT